MTTVLWENETRANGATNAIRPLTHPLDVTEKGAAAMVRPPKTEKCSGPSCDEPVRCRGLCALHYTRLRLTGDPQFDKPRRVKLTGAGKPYHPAMVLAVRCLYELEGLPVERVAAEIETTIGRVYKILERHGIPRRRTGPPAMFGTDSPMWKGDAASYSALHHRVTSQRGRPARCEKCGNDDPAKRYEWANMTGRYSDVNDYQRMCVPCHRRMDADRRAALGTNTVPEQWTP